MKEYAVFPLPFLSYKKLMAWQFPFHFREPGEPDISGLLLLESPHPYPYVSDCGGVALREGELTVENGRQLDVVLYHNSATEAFFYVSEMQLTGQLGAMLGLPTAKAAPLPTVRLPGQFVLGSRRTRLVHRAMEDVIAAPMWAERIAGAGIDEIVVFPIVREGVKFGIAEAIAFRYDWLVEEVLVDAHHVYDSEVPGYGRRTRIAVFKDNDLSEGQRQSMKTAIVGDSIASGTVLISVIDALCERYAGLENVEIIAPFAALRGLARIAHHMKTDVNVRVHAFETLLNALAPDYYWSAHYSEPEFHFDASLEAQYRAWWGEDALGNQIADTACAGYGWSEAFFNPGKHLRMINGQLQERHGLTSDEIIRRNVVLAK